MDQKHLLSKDLLSFLSLLFLSTFLISLTFFQKWTWRTCRASLQDGRGVHAQIMARSHLPVFSRQHRTHFSTQYASFDTTTSSGTTFYFSFHIVEVVAGVSTEGFAIALSLTQGMCMYSWGKSYRCAFAILWHIAWHNRVFWSHRPLLANRRRNLAQIGWAA